MPMINGVKMACEPCIRGHRSTKCGHANERLMVPVRKPGRPLSACPHPKDRPCSCGSVTAAIPKKQACGCGGSSTAPDHAASHIPEQSSVEPTSPSRSAFKVQKPSAKPNSTRKQSFDVSNFDRIDMSNVNVVPFESRPSNAMPIMYPNGYAIAGDPQDYGFVPQYANFQPQDFKIPMQNPQLGGPGLSAGMNSIDGSMAHTVAHDPLSIPNSSTNDKSNAVASKPAISTESDATKAANGEVKAPTNGGSCCGTKNPTHSHSSSSASSISEPEEQVVASCCSSTPTPVVKDEKQSNDSIFATFSPQADQQMLLGNDTPFSPVFYPQYLSQSGIFTYPSTYGSFNNPLDPSAWRQSSQTNGHGLSEVHGGSNPNAADLGTMPAPSTKDTIHTCHCGDRCQCIGCAAHPYNDATQKYVRSAYTSMTEDGLSRESYVNGSPAVPRSSIDVNGTHGTEAVTSPTANTPSSATSANGEEPNLSAADFFFVNYSFPECGGDTESCPCGDDCQCIGCTIHNLPAVATEQ